jgi:hypothetical protein
MMEINNREWYATQIRVLVGKQLIDLSFPVGTPSVLPGRLDRTPRPPPLQLKRKRLVVSLDCFRRQLLIDVPEKKLIQCS